jgi:hypothetical protein
MGGTSAVDEFSRLFLAPGISRCWGGWSCAGGSVKCCCAVGRGGRAPERLVAEFVNVGGRGGEEEAL